MTSRTATASVTTGRPCGRSGEKRRRSTPATRCWRLRGWRWRAFRQHPEVLRSRAAASDEATLEMVEGQVLDLEFETRTSVTWMSTSRWSIARRARCSGPRSVSARSWPGADEARYEEFERLGRRWAPPSRFTTTY